MPKGKASNAYAEPRRRKPKQSYRSYIYKVMRSVNPDAGITTKGMSVLEDFVQDLFERIGREAERVADKNGHATLTARDVQTATRLVLNGQLSEHACNEGRKAVTKYCKSFQ